MVAIHKPLLDELEKSKMTTTPSLAEVIALSEKATAGPWLADGQKVFAPEMPKRTWGDDGEFSGDFIVVQTALYTSPEREDADTNAAFIAALVNWFRTSAASLRDEGVVVDAVRPILPDLEYAIALAGQHNETRAVAMSIRLDALRAALTRTPASVSDLPKGFIPKHPLEWEDNK